MITDHIDPAIEMTIGNLLDFWIDDLATQSFRKTMQCNYFEWPIKEVPHRCWKRFGDSERIVHGSDLLVGLNQPLFARAPGHGKLCSLQRWSKRLRTE